MVVVAIGGGLVASSSSPAAWTILVVGVGLLLVALFDFPIVSRFDATGVHRRCLLRTATLPWSDLASVSRPGRTLRRRAMNMANTAGLTADIGRARHLLTDKIESRQEYEALKALLDHWEPGLPLRASEPPEGAAPTWMYKRRPSEGLVDLR